MSTFKKLPSCWVARKIYRQQEVCVICGGFCHHTASISPEIFKHAMTSHTFISRKPKNGFNDSFLHSAQYHFSFCPSHWAYLYSHYIHTYVLGPQRWEGSTGVDIPRISFSIKLKLYWTGQLWFPSHGFSPSKVNIPLEALTNIKIPISLSNPLSTGVIETFYVVLTKYGTVIALTAPPGYFSVICLPVSSTTDTTQWCQRPNSSLIPPFLVCPTKQLSLN